MQRFRRIVLLAGLSVVVLFWGIIGSTTTLFGQACALDQAAQHEFVAQLFKSVEQFELVAFNDFSLDRFPIGLNDAGTVKTLPISISFKGVRDSGFVTQVFAQAPGASPVEVRSVEVPLPRAFGGFALDNIGNSAVSVYVTDRFVSGFLLTDLDDVHAPWYFIEPLQPLLQMQPAVQNDANLRATAEACFTSTHIVYDVRKTYGKIQLGPVVESEASDLEMSAQGTIVVPIVAVADAPFYNLYANEVQAKMWWEAQEEVISLVDELYQQDLGVALKIHAMEAWEVGGPGTAILDPDGDGVLDLDADADDMVDINAWNLLCNFAQGLPNQVPHSHAAHESELSITHLFSGYDLGPIRAHTESVTDYGTWCGNNCGTFGKDVTGLAEGIGGLWSAYSESCHSQLTIDPAAHHSLSQQVPKVQYANQHSMNEHFEGLLYQRFLMVAHEIGHNLGATHQADGGVMANILTKTTRFSMGNSGAEMLNCLLNGC